MGNRNGSGTPAGRQPDGSAWPPGTTPIGTARVNSQTLLGGGNELVIEHAGREYRLRITQNGKLILTA